LEGTRELRALPIQVADLTAGRTGFRYIAVDGVFRSRHQERSGDAVIRMGSGATVFEALLLDTELSPEQRGYAETVRRSGECLRSRARRRMGRGSRLAARRPPTSRTRFHGSLLHRSPHRSAMNLANGSIFISMLARSSAAK
jgi:hypothetical protein